MFEITGDDIAALGDEDLRTLVGRLCEAELRRCGLSTSASTWGGNQTAKDGGLDVRVALPAGTKIDGFIPKADTGFQVKKPDMPRGEIIEEMKPKGVLRPMIAQLAKGSGAYIIISAAGSTADSALKSRRDAMAEAVKGVPGAEKLTLDFFDRNRLATWVRDHAGLIPWVRSRIGKAIPGWRAYGGWSYRPEGADPAYLVDEGARIRTGDKDEGDGISAADGVNKIRDVLRTPGHVVRLVGLSGVGKTRLAEALFEPAVGVNALDPSLAVYTDVAEGPDPQPSGLASDFIAAGTRAILVIDNCPPTTHRQLTEVARAKGSTISVITIEYDIREDQPEGTDVFSLDTSSPGLIEKLIEKRFPALSQVDRHTIADSSGGNARVALALAGTVGKNETVAGLSDDLLFRRLFQQRNDPDATLLSIAQACSLVYSFEGEMLDDEDAELPVLGGLIGRTAEEVFGGIADLKQRNLVQMRGPWRAVLPHAIANRLAIMALERIPRQKLLASIESGSARLLKSFSRRLGYLDSSKEARAIVQGWLTPGGLLADVANLNELGRAMFKNVAPVMPDAVLSALENVIAGANSATLGKCKHFVRLLRSLAYGPEHFERAVSLLIKLVRLPAEDHEDEEVAKIVESLFHVVLSGTHAPIAIRLKVAEGLLRSKDAAEQLLGVKALEATLKTSHFSSTYNFEFGVRSRDYGYYPPTSKDVQDWFTAALGLAERFATSDSPVADDVRRAIANEFRGLWTNVTRADPLERISHAVAARGFWREGWIAARRVRIHDSGRFPPEALARIKALEELLRPKDLINKVRGVVLNAKGGSIDLDDLDEVKDDDYAGAMARATRTVEALGRDVAADEAAFKTLLPELMGGEGKIVGFGRGLGFAAEAPHEMWLAIVAQAAAKKDSSLSLLRGFLEGLQARERAITDALLDEAVEHPSLGMWFPGLQAAVAIDHKALGRLHHALALKQAPIQTFYALAYGRASDAIPAPEFKRLVLAIGAKAGGNPVAMEIVSMRLHSHGSDKKPVAPEVAEAGRELLMAYEFHRRDNRAIREDYELGVVTRASLAGDEGRPIVRRLCKDLLAAAARYDVSAYDYDDLMKGLFAVHPTDVLDELMSGGKKAQDNSVRLMHDLSHLGTSPMDVVPDGVIAEWCDRKPKTRYPFAAEIVPLFDENSGQNPKEWKTLARTLLLRAADKKAVFKGIVSRLYPSGGVGSRSSQYDARLKLLEKLDLSGMPELGDMYEKAKAALETQVDTERRHETERGRSRSGRFEE